MNEQPFFSVICPVYNVKDYVGEAIESVLMQKSQNYELLLIDDGSTDNSLQICLDYARRYPQITVLRKQNGGLSSARNMGLRLAKGKYIMFLDSDDYWENPITLSDLENLAREADMPDLLLHNYHTLYMSDNRKEYYVFNIGEISGNFQNDFESIRQQGRELYRSSPWTKVTKAEVIRQAGLSFPEGLIHEDSLWSFELARHAKSYAVYDSSFYVYRSRPHSTTSVCTIKNVRDLLEITYTNLLKLEEIRREQPVSYKGLFEYLWQEFDYVQLWFTYLNQDEQGELLDKLVRCRALRDEIKQRDFNDVQ